MIETTIINAPDREQEINSLIRQANLNNGLYLQEFGLTISNNMMEVRGRILPPPKLQYGRTLPDQVKIYILTMYNFCYSDHFDKKPFLTNI